MVGPRPQYRTALPLAGLLLLAGCAAPAPWQVIDNVLTHEPPAPHVPATVRALLARPLHAREAAPVFDAAVPEALRRLAEPASALPGPLEPHLAALAEAQRALRGARRGAPVDAGALLLELESAPPSAAAQRQLAAGYDPQALERATALFLQAVAGLARARPALQGPARFDSPVGTVSVGTPGDDEHGPEAAVILDPGGNDTYERAPVTGDGVSVIVDYGGDDDYRGSDVAIQGLSAILDLAGNDRYESGGPGWGAALGGVSVLVDYAGNDAYESGVFAQGAAAAGLGALLDLGGDDTYRLRALGQGLGLAGGTGLLWDRAGNDSYAASGLRDRFARGGGLSFAQGAALGVRTALPGGIGILRDDAGNDSYAAQMFAQGMGYYYGLGLLWERAGSDRYTAVRYAQGNGAHVAVGVLRDESGDDRYDMTVGVGQGMGLDLAVGALADLGGDDRYAAPALAQAAATANGVGILDDSGGSNEWRMDQGNGWGRAEGWRGLPSVGLLRFDAARASFLLAGKPAGAPKVEPAAARATGTERRCPAPPGVPPDAGLPLADALRSLGPGFVSGRVDAGAYAQVLWRLRTQPGPALAELPADDFDVMWALGTALRCALEGADDSQARDMHNAFADMLAAQPASPFALPIAQALRARPAPNAAMRRMLGLLAAHPSCDVRAEALLLQRWAEAAQAALGSSCWRLQAAGLRVLDELGVAPRSAGAVPPFLR
jgi:hypothetical protein